MTNINSVEVITGVRMHFLPKSYELEICTRTHQNYNNPHTLVCVKRHLPRDRFSDIEVINHPKSASAGRVYRYVYHILFNFPREGFIVSRCFTWIDQYVVI